MAALCHLYALHFLRTHETFTGPSESTLVKCSNYTPKCRCEQGELHTKLFALLAAAALFPHWSQIFFLFQGPHRTQPFLSGAFPTSASEDCEQHFANIKLALTCFCLSASHAEGRSISFGIGLDTWLRISQLLERLSYLPDPTKWCDSTVVTSPAVRWRAAERKGCTRFTLGRLLPSVISFFPSAPQHQLSSQLYCILFTLHTLPSMTQ